MQLKDGLVSFSVLWRRLLLEKGEAGVSSSLWHHLIWRNVTSEMLETTVEK